jgi:hypothetical protein
VPPRIAEAQAEQCLAFAAAIGLANRQSWKDGQQPGTNIETPRRSPPDGVLTPIVVLVGGAHLPRAAAGLAIAQHALTRSVAVVMLLDGTATFGASGHLGHRLCLAWDSAQVWACPEQLVDASAHPAQHTQWSRPNGLLAKREGRGRQPAPMRPDCGDT